MGGIVCVGDKGPERDVSRPRYVLSNIEEVNKTYLPFHKVNQTLPTEISSIGIVIVYEENKAGFTEGVQRPPQAATMRTTKRG
jgi:hypothetical protein